MFTTFAVAAIVIVTGFRPQSNVMIPPFATALTTADDVQLAGVPVPTTRFGCAVSTARAAAGIAAVPALLPHVGAGAFDGDGLGGEGFGLADGFAVIATLDEAAAAAG